MQQVIEQGQNLIQELQSQVEDLSDELRDKQTELAIKAKENEDDKQIGIEKNDLQLLKIESDNQKAQKDHEFKMAALRVKEQELALKTAQAVANEVNTELQTETN